MPASSGGPKCRSCGAALEHTFVDLGPSPVSNAFRRAADWDRPELFFPLHVYVCTQCWLVQLPAIHKPESLFNEDYVYFSSFSLSWLDHARQYASQMIERFAIGPADLVVEVASNDGYLLQFFKESGVPVLGIDPSGNVATVAERERGVPTRVEFFGRATARELKAEGISARLITANNVLAHVPDIQDFVGGFRLLLSPDGITTFEFPHLLNLIRYSQFDTIYHEHYSYLSLKAVETIFEQHDLRVFDVERLATHGGSLRLYVCHHDAAFTEQPGVSALRRYEYDAGIDRLDIYAQFSQRVQETKRRILQSLIGIKESGKTIVGYGAPAKGNTLLNYCGIRTDFIPYTVDRNPNKQGTFLPGTGIPVLSPDAIEETRPDYVLILPWNLQEEIMRSLGYIRSWGGRFVLPIPEPRVIE